MLEVWNWSLEHGGVTDGYTTEDNGCYSPRACQLPIVQHGEHGDP